MIMSNLQYWLVDHPTILHFTWTQGQTPFSTPLFLFLTILTYLSLTLLLTRLPLPTPVNLLKPISAVHNLVLLLLSLIMAVGCSLSILSSPHSTLCFPPSRITSPSGPLFFWAYVFYLSKFLELLDTLLIVLSGSSGRQRRRLSFLHVYHHATVLVMCYVWLRTRQSLFPVALVTNAAVHVIMYGYYFLCAVGIRPRWKRAVTDCQIVQFVFSFAVSGRMLQQHFSSPGSGGCSGIWGWCFNAVFNASLLALFLDFHGKSYPNTTNKRIMGQHQKEDKKGS